jgi:hypothetical protein
MKTIQTGSIDMNEIPKAKEEERLKDLINQFIYEHDELWVEDDEVFNELARMVGYFDYEYRRRNQ